MRRTILPILPAWAMLAGCVSSDPSVSTVGCPAEPLAPIDWDEPVGAITARTVMPEEGRTEVWDVRWKSPAQPDRDLMTVDFVPGSPWRVVRAGGDHCRSGTFVRVDVQVSMVSEDGELTITAPGWFEAADTGEETIFVWASTREGVEVSTDREAWADGQLLPRREITGFSLWLAGVLAEPTISVDAHYESWDARGISRMWWSEEVEVLP